MTASESTLSNDLVLERLLAAPRMAIWRCWTEPALMEQWFCPKPWYVGDVKIELRAGGATSMTMNGPAGEKFPNQGVYLKVVPGQRLVFTDAFTSAWQPSGKAFMVAQVTLADAPGGGTLYKALARHWNAEDRAAHEKMGFHQGGALQQVSSKRWPKRFSPQREPNHAQAIASIKVSSLQPQAMTTPTTFKVQRLLPEHAALVSGLLDMFGAAFEDTPSYSAKRPDTAYLHKLLARERHRLGGCGRSTRYWRPGGL